MKSSIIIVNWKSYEFIKNLLHSIKTFPPPQPFEIIISDNLPEKDKIEEIKNVFPEVKFILNKKNTGFGTACNIAAEKAKGEILFFINPDITLQKNSLKTLYNELISNKKAGIVGPKIISPNGEIQKDCARRKLPTVFSMFCNIFLLKRIFSKTLLFNEYLKNYEKKQEVPFISGALMGIRKSVFNSIGGFSPLYFMYSEDADLCRKTLSRGMVNIYIPESTVIHKSGSSTSKKEQSKVFEAWFFKSRLTYMEQEGKFKSSLLKLIYILGGAFRIFLAFLMQLFYTITQNTNKKKQNREIIKKYLEVILTAFNKSKLKKN